MEALVTEVFAVHQFLLYTLVVRDREAQWHLFSELLHVHDQMKELETFQDHMVNF